ncbi:imidazole glycerol phosphate synthase subunit HisH [Anaerotruncus colihominis]|uniref:Imidazole glycerol phosphate synthase subunit HisH n=1 Tax=Anaerotruncus colihominis TaxID=169435 RepID=A0A845RFL5_9FIRM|nr:MULTISPECIES: imidazole glycerol phosphate synthase subunit HisH [Anaerotruncus]MCI8491645.1 imidazole glycerol phosphate synthase subunit HisH [Anaerotruncus sp.]NBI77768.1 imidazole glycerol phosphate synthase subunit HisH [Anaerotruncus colihominis]
MIAIVDYGAGNLFSVQNALAYLNITCCTTNDPAVLKICDGMVLPGVGAFPEAMRRLHASGLVPVIQAEAQKKPLLGICLGMQMLFERGYEFEETQGLGLIPGEVRLIKGGGLKIPHMGWNDLTILHPCTLTEHTKNGDYVYFVHSYCAQTPDENISCYTVYGERIPALVHRGFIYGAQFHPEKSGEVGLAMLKNFARLCQ